MTHGGFVTGTDTGVGKTLVACALLHALRERGVRAVPMKPVAAGASEFDGRWVNEDTLRLIDAAGRLETDDAALVTPILLREPMAPHIAAAREGRAIDLADVARADGALRAKGDFVVAEGVGGFCVPLAEAVDTVGLARMMDLPVAMVVGLRLGCLNHALLTAQAVRAAGLRLAGWVANAIDPDLPVREEHVAAREERLGAPLLGRIPFAPHAEPRELARHLDISALLSG